MAMPGCASMQRLLADVQRMSEGKKISWRAFVQALKAAQIRFDKWDLAVLGSAFIVYDEPGKSKLIKAVDQKLWTVNSESGIYGEG